MSIKSFNKELLTSMITDCSSSLDRSLRQHLLLSSQLKHASTRFQRAKQQGHQSNAYRESMRITTVSGMMSMYEEHMKRKAAKLHRLKLYLRRVEHTDKTSTTNNTPTRTSTVQKRSLQSTVPHAEDITPSDNSSAKVQGQISIGKLLTSIENSQPMSNSAQEKDKMLADACDEQSASDKEMLSPLQPPKRKRIDNVGDS